MTDYSLCLSNIRCLNGKRLKYAASIIILPFTLWISISPNFNLLNTIPKPPKAVLITVEHFAIE